jgi:hypothetical protein
MPYGRSGDHAFQCVGRKPLYWRYRGFESCRGRGYVSRVCVFFWFVQVAASTREWALVRKVLTDGRARECVCVCDIAIKTCMFRFDLGCNTTEKNCIWWEVKAAQLIIMQFLPASCYAPLIFFITLLLPSIWKTEFYTHTNQLSSVYLNLKVISCKWI